MEKQDVLDNIAAIEAEQLFLEIERGVVLLSELMDTGKLSTLKLRKIVAMLEQKADEDDDAWEWARYNDESALADYISRFPKGKHLQQAVKKIEWLATERSRLLSAKQLVLDNLATDPNSYFVDEILELIKQKLISREELLEIGFPGKIIECFDANGPHLDTVLRPSSVPDGYT